MTIAEVQAGGKKFPNYFAAEGKAIKMSCGNLGAMPLSYFRISAIWRHYHIETLVRNFEAMYIMYTVKQKKGSYVW